MSISANNVLQPSAVANGCGGQASDEFMGTLCNALLHTLHNDNTQRQQAEQFMH